MFFLRKKLSTVGKVLQDCRQEIDGFHQMSATSLWRVLMKRTKKRQLYERLDVIAAHVEYLRAVRSYQLDGRLIIYLDETWFNQHHTVGRTWQEDESSPEDAPTMNMSLHFNCIVYCVVVHASHASEVENAQCYITVHDCHA